MTLHYLIDTQQCKTIDTQQCKTIMTLSNNKVRKSLEALFKWVSCENFEQCLFVIHCYPSYPEGKKIHFNIQTQHLCLPLPYISDMPSIHT
jgi:hypothetical protein